MTYAPARLLELRAFMRPITGLPDASLGITPDPAHIGGYHCGWDRRRIVNGSLSDYSWQESPRDSSHKTDAASAFDLGMFSRLREFSVWLVGQCAAGAEDCRDIREVIYSPDGKVVKRWDRLGRRSTGDNSHLTHTHISFFRDAEGRSKIGPFKRFFEGAIDMDQAERLAAATYRPETTISDVFGDVQNRRNWLIGETPSPVHGDTSGVFPRKGSPDWNVANLPRLLAEHASAPVDPAALAAVVKPMLDAMEARLEAKIRDAVADGLEGGAAGVRASQ